MLRFVKRDFDTDARLLVTRPYLKNPFALSVAPIILRLRRAAYAQDERHGTIERLLITDYRFASLIVHIMLESPAAPYGGNAGTEPDKAEKSGSIHESL